MATLPTLGLQLPIDWQGNILKKEYETDSYTLEVVNGLRPWRETTTITYKGTAAEMRAHLDRFKSSRFAEVFEYDCGTLGPIRVRPMTNYSIRENHDGMLVVFTIAIRRID